MLLSICCFVVMAVVMVLVSSEVHSLIGAVSYGLKTEGSTLHRLKIGYLRFTWSSTVFHELFAFEMNKAPAYRFSVPFLLACVQLLASLALANATMSGPLLVYASVLTGAGFFAGAYGRAFMAESTAVNAQKQAGTWHHA